jgi:hypothetical protein
MHALVRPLVSLLLATLMLGVFDAGASAQRRRRRRRPPAEQVETPPPVEETPDADAGTAPAPNPFGDPNTTVQMDTEGPPAPPGSNPVPAEEPSTTPTEELDPGPAPPDVSPIRADYVTLMDDLVQARMRVHALGNELFRTRIKVDLQDRTGGNVTVARMVLHLDGAPIFQSDGPVERAADGRELFTGALAPGPHVLTLEVEQRAREDDQYRYTLRETFRFQVVRERLSEVTLILEDGSDIARSFPAGGEGRYEVRTRVRVATRALPEQ